MRCYADMVSEQGVPKSNKVDKVAGEQPTPDAILLDLIRACREQLNKHEKLYFEFGIVPSKKDINREKQLRVKEAAENLSVRALAVARHCVLNVHVLSLKSLDQATDAVETAKLGREFAEDPCKDLKFSVKQLSGLWNFYCVLALKLTISELVVAEKKKREKKSTKDKDGDESKKVYLFVHNIF